MFKIFKRLTAISIVFFLVLFIYASIGISGQDELPTGQTLSEVKTRVLSTLENEMENAGFRWGAPVFLRIFKDVKFPGGYRAYGRRNKSYGENGVLEVWVQRNDQFCLFRSYAVCYFSGSPGPKTEQGDYQSPKGFYFVTPQRMNPYSSYHLAFNLGYPNVYDRAHERTGSALMVHGNCCSVGCYAMTDPKIEEIYLLVEAALSAGQPFVRVHIFPFPMTDENMEAAEGSQWIDFWKNLKEGYDFFENNKVPPNVEVSNRRYIFKVEEVAPAAFPVAGSPSPQAHPGDALD
ncbi:L,D-transpeptidase family protein [Desulfatibacillum aliphaticivorans]|uniref:L,D-transpeptidase family protein n=1 Tax=Desulfatibacillum aliphaticivorans TaxID=218208 RepID=UPI0003FCB34B|nr:murein L,D-transpeptidase family protein [Desulfatibacillum aliphaticivorans]